MQTLIQAAHALATGETTSLALVERCLARIADPAGEGARTFMVTYAQQARASAAAMDALRRAGRAPGPYAGIPVSLKDLLDVAGEVTRAGSVVLEARAPAGAHAAVVQRLLAAGLVPVGRTTMTEFAFSGLGINPHHGTPRAPWDRAVGRIPGGSSSGAAVSVADGMALAALGTDTGGSCRVPAAFCGVVGYKPTARRVPLAGVLPLSPTLDSVGPLAPSVACCAVVDAILAGEAPVVPAAASLAGLRLGVPTNIVMDGLDGPTGAAFERALSLLERAGVRLERRRFAALDRIGPANAGGGFAAAEAYAWHRATLAEAGRRYDPRVRVRIERGEWMGGAEYVALVAERRAIIAAMDADTAGLDALAMPTVPVVPPPVAALEDEGEYNRVNMLVLRNPALFNVADRCAISLPCHRAGEPPAGLMLVGETMGDGRLFAVARAVEGVIGG